MAKKKFNKTQLIKEAVSASPEATPKEIAETLKKYDITATYVSNVKGIMKAKPKKRRRPKGSPSQSVVRTAAITDTLDAAIKFVEQCGGLKAAKAAIEKIERIKSL
jgi:CBS domain-containing protein